MHVDLVLTGDQQAGRDPHADGCSPGETVRQTLTFPAPRWPQSQPWDREEGSCHPSDPNLLEKNFYNISKSTITLYKNTFVDIKKSIHTVTESLHSRAELFGTNHLDTLMQQQ